MARKRSDNQPGLFGDDPPTEMPAHVVRPVRPRSSAGSAAKPVERETRVQCRAVGCPAPINPVKLMCAAHWHQVAPAVQKRILQHYRPGQSIESASRPYLLAAAEAVEAVAAAEGRDTANVFRAIVEGRDGP
jgi:hypothetical protein